MRACRYFFLPLMVAVLAAPAAAVEAEVRRTFPVQPGCTLVVHSYRGNITVEESDVPEIRIRLDVDVDAPSDAEAQRLRDELRLEMGERGNHVTIIARNPRESGPRLTARAGRLELDFRIAVPRVCNVDLRVQEGALTVGSLTGRMSAQVGKGGIFYRRIEGSIEASVERGDIVVSSCSGAVSAKVRQGAIRVGTIGGRFDLSNSSGGIEVMAARFGGQAAAEAGDITVGFARNFSSASRLTTSGGNILVTLDPQLACSVQASSVWGRVQTDLGWAIDEGASGKGKFAGRLNGGGPLLTLRANGGQVRISGGDVPFD